MKPFTLALPMLAVTLLAMPARAQITSPGQTGLNAAMTKLFGDVTAFSARTEVRMLDKQDKESMRMTMNFALLDGKMRAEIDLAQIKTADMPPEAAASLKQMGMDKMVSIVRPDRKSTLVVYPSLSAFAEVPMSPEDAADLEKKYKVTRTKAGRETIDGHPCDKSKVMVIGDKNEKHEAIVWTATDMKDFPIQMQMNQAEATIVMLYKDVKLTKPEAKQFDAPAGFAKHESIEKLMQGAMLKAFGGAK